MSLEQHKKSITKVFDKDTSEQLAEYDLLLTSHMSSNTKIPVPRLITDNKSIGRNNSLCVEYCCFTCQTVNQVTVNLFLRRVSKGRKGCPACRNNDEEKTEQHRVFMLEGGIPTVKAKKWSDMSFNERFAESNAKYNDMDDEFKQRYRLAHLDSDEFATIRCKIKAVGNNKIKDITGWEYFANYCCGNQTQFTPILVNRQKGIVEKPKYITWMCDECDNEFMGRDLEVQKNRLRILCQACTLCNKTFKIRHLTLANGKRLRWQSVPERRFIEWCEEYGLEIENGPIIQYTLAGKHHKYLVDFALPTLKRLVEIKDNHVWHQQQVAKGKFSAKNAATNEWSQVNGWKFDVLFPKDMVDYKTTVMKEKSLCKI